MTRAWREPHGLPAGPAALGASGVRLTDKGEIALDQIVTFGRPVFCGNATLAAQPLPHQARLDVAPAASGKSYDNAHGRAK